MKRILFGLLYFAALPMLAIAAPEGVPMIGRLPAGKVLFLGNSITFHSPAPDIGWNGKWGMAASAEDKDYVHRFAAALAEETGTVPQTRVRNIADFERGYEGYDLAAELKTDLDFGADLVVVAIGENVAALATEEAQGKFAVAIARLLSEIKRHGQPTLLVRSCFWPDAAKDEILRKASADAGATFVDIGALGGEASNKAPEFTHPGVAAHPGDMGMRAIAAALFRALQEKAGPAVVLRGEADTELAPHGGGNIYAPDIHRDGDRWLMWYGGQGKDGHDRIHLAESSDGRAWTKRGVVLDCGTANHVNDPSVVRVGEVWWMFYTVAETAEQDEIAAATSPDGVTWEKRGVVLARGEDSEWDSGKVGRPSVLHENGIFRLWFDGQPTPEAAAVNPLAVEIKREGRALGYAESADGLTWKRRPEPVFRESAGAVHVTRIDKRFVMLIESSAGIRWAQSRDGFRWIPRGLLLPLSDGTMDRFGQVTPFLDIENGQATLYFGAAARRTWDGNSIASVGIPLPE